MTILNAGNRIINRYLLPISENFVLIDTGMKGSFQKFCDSLKELNIPLEKITHLVITHAHADHAGFAKEFLEKTGAYLIYSPKAKTRLEAGKNNMKVFISTFANLMMSKVSISFVNTTQCYPAVFYDRVLPLSVRPLSEFGIEFIELKGHTDADLAIKADGKLFCGDICMNGFPSQKHFPLWLENKFELIKSWETIIEMTDVNEIYPAHGKPFPKSELPKCLTYWKNKGVLSLMSKK